MSVLEVLPRQDEKTEKEQPEGLRKRGMGHRAERKSLPEGEMSLDYVSLHAHLSISSE